MIGSGFGWGSRVLADKDAIPDFSRVEDPAFAATGTTNVVKANFELINDNLMDLSHVGYVHGSTIGTTEMGGKAQMKTERTEKGVRVTRWVFDCPPPPTYVKTGSLSPRGTGLTAGKSSTSSRPVSSPFTSAERPPAPVHRKAIGLAALACG